MNQDELAALREMIENLEAQLEERKAALPAHSPRPGQIIEIEELEELIKDLGKKIEEYRG